VACVVVTAVVGPLLAAPASTGEAINVVATRLDNNQIKDGNSQGMWPEEAGFTGSIVAGMSTAFEHTCEEDWRDSAELGGDYIVADGNATGVFYGDEAFALAELSRISSAPNQWQQPLADFYGDVRNSEGGTSGYISYFETGPEPSTAVFYLAYHAVASDYVEAVDKQLWRDSVSDFLARVDDNVADYPVLALGVAIWSLAETGELDDTLVDPCGTGQPYWNDIHLSDLPGILAGHQRMEEPHSGCFYWRFDHTDGAGGGGPDAYGYTEDCIFGALGLAAAVQNAPNLNYDTAIVAMKESLVNSIADDGTVYGHLWLNSPQYYVYAGEMLQALGYVVVPGDMDLDDSVNGFDLAILADNWLSSCDGTCCWCDGSDIDNSGRVNFVDFAYFANNWLTEGSGITWSGTGGSDGSTSSASYEVNVTETSLRPAPSWVREPVR